jgi:hypothetical protein
MRTQSGELPLTLGEGFCARGETRWNSRTQGVILRKQYHGSTLRWDGALARSRDA